MQAVASSVQRAGEGPWQHRVPAEASSIHQQPSQCSRRDGSSAPEPGESQWHIHQDSEDEEVTWWRVKAIATVTAIYLSLFFYLLSLQREIRIKPDAEGRKEERKEQKSESSDCLQQRSLVLMKEKIRGVTWENFNTAQKDSQQFTRWYKSTNFKCALKQTLSLQCRRKTPSKSQMKGLSFPELKESKHAKRSQLSFWKLCLLCYKN